MATMMKIGLITCALLSVFGLISAAPTSLATAPQYLPATSFKLKPMYRPIALFKATPMDNVDYPKTTIPPFGNKVTYSHSINSIGKTANNQWIGAATRLVGSAIGSRILNNVVDCRVCGNCNTELQQDTDIEERSAKIMALVQIMDEINAAKESLNELEKHSMKDNRIAEAEFVSGKINSIRDALGNAGEYLKGAAKNVLCR